MVAIIYNEPLKKIDAREGKGWAERGSGSRIGPEQTGFGEGPSFQREEAEATVGSPGQPRGSPLPGSWQIPKTKPESQRPFLRAEAGGERNRRLLEPPASSVTGPCMGPGM